MSPITSLTGGPTWPITARLRPRCQAAAASSPTDPVLWVWKLATASKRISGGFTERCGCNLFLTPCSGAQRCPLKSVTANNEGASVISYHWASTSGSVHIIELHNLDQRRSKRWSPRRGLEDHMEIKAALLLLLFGSCCCGGEQQILLQRQATAPDLGSHSSKPSQPIEWDRTQNPQRTVRFKEIHTIIGGLDYGKNLYNHPASTKSEKETAASYFTNKYTFEIRDAPNLSSSELNLMKSTQSRSLSTFRLHQLARNPRLRRPISTLRLL